MVESLEQLKNLYKKYITPVFNINVPESLFCKPKEELRRRFHGPDNRVPRQGNNKLSSEFHSIITNLSNVISFRGEEVSIPFVNIAGKPYDQAHRLIREVMELIILMDEASDIKSREELDRLLRMIKAVENFLEEILVGEIFRETAPDINVNSAIIDVHGKLGNLRHKANNRYHTRLVAENLIVGIRDNFYNKLPLFLFNYLNYVANFQEENVGEVSLLNLAAAGDKNKFENLLYKAFYVSGLLRGNEESRSPMALTSNNNDNGANTSILQVNSSKQKAEASEGAVWSLYVEPNAENKRSKLGMSALFENPRPKIRLIELIGWFQRYMSLVKKVIALETIATNFGELGVFCAINEYIDGVAEAEKLLKARITECQFSLSRMVRMECLANDSDLGGLANFRKAQEQWNKVLQCLREISSNITEMHSHIYKIQAVLPSIKKDSMEQQTKIAATLSELGTVLGVTSGSKSKLAICLSRPNSIVSGLKKIADSPSSARQNSVEEGYNYSSDEEHENEILREVFHRARFLRRKKLEDYDREMAENRSTPADLADSQTSVSARSTIDDEDNNRITIINKSACQAQKYQERDDV